MTGQVWRNDCHKTIVCLDSYEKGIPVGRVYIPYRQMETFESLSQFLIRMEGLLDEMNMPQAYTQTRTFARVSDYLEDDPEYTQVRKGSKATFEVQVIFRQHTSWQGVITWLDRKLEQSFRSVLELILLMDSALRGQEGSGMV